MQSIPCKIVKKNLFEIFGEIPSDISEEIFGKKNPERTPGETCKEISGLIAEVFPWNIINVCYVPHMNFEFTSDPLEFLANRYSHPKRRRRSVRPRASVVAGVRGDMMKFALATILNHSHGENF